MITKEMLSAAECTLEEVLGSKARYIMPADGMERILTAAFAAMPGPAVIRNDDVGFVEFVNEDRPYIVREINGPCAILTDMETRNVIGYRVYDHGCSERDVFAAPDLASENERLRAALEKITQRVGGTVCPGQDMEMTRARVRFLEDDIRDIARATLERT